MTRDTRRAGAFLVALGGAVAVLAFMAGPAFADPDPTSRTSGGAIATDGSVASGSAHATDDSVASGDATAVDDSVASGCSTAIDDSTASGDDCDRKKKDDDKDKDKDKKPVVHRPSGGGGGGGGGVGGGATRAAAGTTAARLALTGTWSIQLTALAALAVVLGALLVVSASERRRAVTRA
jgi:hypothetical protein